MRNDGSRLLMLHLLRAVSGQGEAWRQRSAIHADHRRPTVRGTNQEHRRDSPDSDRRAAMQRNVGQGQLQNMTVADDQSCCAFMPTAFAAIAANVCCVALNRKQISLFSAAYRSTATVDLRGRRPMRWKTFLPMSIPITVIADAAVLVVLAMGALLDWQPQSSLRR